MVEYAIDKHYDGIALSIAHPTRFTEVVNKARNAGIPLIAFNMDSMETSRMAGVSQDFYKAGTEFGRRVIDRLAHKSKVLATMHDAGIPALVERLRGISDVLSAKEIGINTIISGNTPQLAKDTILNNLTPDIDAVLCTGLSDTHGAGIAATITGRRVYVAGFDICEEILTFIKSKIIDFSIDQQPYVQGFYPLLMMAQYRAMGVMPFDIDTGCNIVDHVH